VKANTAVKSSNAASKQVQKPAGDNTAIVDIGAGGKDNSAVSVLTASKDNSNTAAFTDAV